MLAFHIMKEMVVRQKRTPTVSRFLRPDADLDSWAVKEARCRGLKNMQALVVSLLWEERKRLEPDLTYNDDGFLD